MGGARAIGSIKVQACAALRPARSRASPGSNPAKLRAMSDGPDPGRSRRPPARQRTRQLLPDRGRQPADAGRRWPARLPPPARRVPALARAQHRRHRRRDPHPRALRPRRDGRGRARRTRPPPSTCTRPDAADGRARARSHERDGSMLPYLRHPALWRLFASAAATARARTPNVTSVTTFTERRPRRPRPPARDPDARPLPRTRRVPPARPRRADRRRRAVHLQPAHGQARPAAAAARVRRRRAAGARLARRRSSASTRGSMLFGHGEPWTEGPAAAVARAREVGSPDRTPAYPDGAPPT